MKNVFKSALVATVAILSLQACNTAQIDDKLTEDNYYYTFTIGSPETRSLLASDNVGKYGEWEDGDKLGTAVNELTPGFSAVDVTKTPVEFKIYKSGGLSENDVIYAYYPYNQSASSASAIPFTIPVSQSQNGTSFDFDAMPMVSEGFVVPADLASTTNQTPVGNIILYNLGSVIDFQVYTSNAEYANETIISVKFDANKALAGSFTKDITGVSFNDENTLIVSGYSESTVTTSVDNAPTYGSMRADAAHIYMVIAPSTGVTGTVLVTTNKAKYTYSLSTAQTFKRAGLKSFGLNLGTCQNRVEEETAIPVTVTTTISEILNGMGKSNVNEGTVVNPLIVDNVVTISTTGTTNNAKVYGSAPSQEWRLYQGGNGNVTVSVPVGYELQTIQFIYSKNNGGTLEGAQSGEVLNVSGRTQTYTVGNTGTATNGQVRLTAISVKYVSVPVPEGYQLLSANEEIESGLYIIAAKVGDKYYAMKNTFASKIVGDEISVSNDVISTSDAEDYSVTLTKGSTATYTIDGINGRLGYSSGTDFAVSDDGSWTINTGNNGTFRVTNTSSTNRVIAFNGTQFGAYAASNVSSGSTSYYDVELFKFNGTAEIKTNPTTTVTPSSPIELNIGDTQQLNVNTDSDGAKSYESSDPTVATVSDAGLITAITAGTATITIKTAATETYSEGTSNVTVEVSDPNAPELSISPATSVASPASWPADNDDPKTFTVTATNGTWAITNNGISSWANVQTSGNVITVTPIDKQASEAHNGTIVVTLTPSNSVYANQTATIYLSQEKYNAGGDTPTPITKNYSFAFSVIGSTGWSNSYANHTLYNDDIVTIKANASKQTSNITDYPVTKGQPLTVVLKDGTMNSVSFVCSQWTTKAQTITLHYSTDGGNTYTSTSITSTNFNISSSSLPTGTNAVKITFSSTSNQVGLNSVEFNYTPSH